MRSDPTALVRYSPQGIFASLGLPPLEYGKVVTLLYLQVRLPVPQIDKNFLLGFFRYTFTRVVGCAHFTVSIVA